MIPAAARPLLPALGRALAGWLPIGARIGEATVASRRVHALRPEAPDEVAVLVDRDAGQAFYGRAHPDEVVHLDIFHAPAAIPPDLVASAFLRARQACRAAGLGDVDPSRFDVQTALGGGCVAGELTGGRGAGVRAAHRGHVHLAGLLADREAAFCFLLVAAVEGALLGIGVELRRPRAVSVRLGPVGLGREDLEPYASPGDSRLTQDGLAPPGDADLAAAAALAEEAGGVRALQAAVEAVGRGLPPEGLGLAPRQAQAALSALWQGGWAAPGPTGWRLTARGHRLRAWLARHLAEVELAARAASRRLGGAGSGGAVRRGPVRVGPPAPGEPWRELAVPETVLHALTRAAGAGRLGAWRVGREDLRLRRRPSRARFDICLLVDASASMEGARMRAAQAVARHLVLTSPGRVAVIAFQERHARVAVPLTRRLAQAERGLAAIAPAGLTPLGVGLDAARRYLAGCRARHPLVFLITDGIPTAAGGEGSPLDEALAAAERLRAARMALACVGLEPHRAYLQELVRRARGRLYVVDELGPQALARLVRAERVRHGAAGRGGRRTSGP